MHTNKPGSDSAVSGVDLEMIVCARSNTEGRFYDPAEGEVYLVSMGQVLTGEDEEPDLDEVDWIRIDGDDARDAYDDMSGFSQTLTDPVLSDRLSRALEGRGAFRRFRDTVAEEGDAFRELWFTFADAHAQRRAVEWLLRNELCTEVEAKAAIRERTATAEQALGMARGWNRRA